MEKTVYYIIAALAAIYLIIGITNKRRAKGRRDRKFMGDYERRDKKKP